MNLENTEDDERVVELNCGIVPSELIADSDCESDSSTDDDMDLEELRLIQLINAKVSQLFKLLNIKFRWVTVTRQAVKQAREAQETEIKLSYSKIIKRC